MKVASNAKVEEKVNSVDENVVDLDFSVIRKTKFRVDGDNNRILELNTSDTSIVSRLDDAYPKLQKLAQEAANSIEIDEDDIEKGLRTTSLALKKTDAKMRELVDYIFDADVSAKCLPSGTMWDLHNGRFAFELVIERIGALYEDNFKREFGLLNQKMKKHTDKYIGKKK